MKRKAGNPKLWSVRASALPHPRHPDIRIRITELKHDGPLFVARQVNGKPRYTKITPTVTRQSLGATTKDQVKAAKVIAHDLIEEIAKEPEKVTATGGDLTLHQLVAKYEIDGLHGTTARYRADQLNRVRRVAKAVGGDTLVTDLTPSVVKRYAAERTAEGVTVAHHAELTALSIACSWAAGEGLVEENPLATPPMRKALKFMHQPKRPVMTKERYLALKAVAPLTSKMFDVLLTLAWHSGHRFSAIQELRWKDVDLTVAKDHPPSITWYAGQPETKKRREHTVPLNAEAHAALVSWQKETGGIGAAYVFPAPQDSKTPVTYHVAKNWLRKAERRAKLKHLEQGGWHMARRGWATERKPFPLKDVADAGGWWDTQTLLGVYQHADPETTRRVATHVA